MGIEPFMTAMIIREGRTYSNYVKKLVADLPLPLIQIYANGTTEGDNNGNGGYLAQFQALSTPHV